MIGVKEVAHDVIMKLTTALRYVAGTHDIIEKRVATSAETQVLALVFSLAFCIIQLPVLALSDELFDFTLAVYGIIGMIITSLIVICCLKYRICSTHVSGYITAVIVQLPYIALGIAQAKVSHFIVWSIRASVGFHIAQVSTEARPSSIALPTFFVLPLTTYVLQSGIEFDPYVTVNQVCIAFLCNIVWHAFFQSTFQTETNSVFDKFLSASEHKSAFLSSVSHELRTPLFGVSGSMDLLASTELSESQQKFVGIARSCTTNLLSIINSVLDLNKIEQGRLEIDNHIVNLNALIDSTMANCAPMALRSKIDVRIEIGQFVPNYFQGDEFRLCQVLTNLLTNALKFSPPNSFVIIAVSLSRTKVAQAKKKKSTSSHRRHSSSPMVKDKSILKQRKLIGPNRASIKRMSSDEGISAVKRNRRKRFLRFAVQDKGFGLLEHEKERIFEAFTQVIGRRANSESRKRYGGVGLGLAICEQLSKKMGGFITVESAGRHKGSTFTFNIPFKDDQIKKQRDWREINRYTKKKATSLIFERRQSLPGVMPIYNANLSAILRPKMRRSLSCNSLPRFKQPIHTGGDDETSPEKRKSAFKTKRAVSSRFFVLDKDSSVQLRKRVISTKPIPKLVASKPRAKTKTCLGVSILVAEVSNDKRLNRNYFLFFFLCFAAFLASIYVLI